VAKEHAYAAIHTQRMILKSIRTEWLRKVTIAQQMVEWHDDQEKVNTVATIPDEYH
jgi:hypothetical protein